MLKIDPEQRSMPDIDPRKVCFIIERARQLMSEEEGPPSDDGGRFALSDAANAPIRNELGQFLEDLDIDEQCALVALAWIGRGDFEAEQWRDAVTLAAGRRDGATSNYLLGLPLLPDYLEEALSAFGCSCEDFRSAA